MKINPSLVKNTWNFFQSTVLSIIPYIKKDHIKVLHSRGGMERNYLKFFTIVTPSSKEKISRIFKN